MTNLRQSNMVSGGIKSRPTSSRPPAPGITVVGAQPGTPRDIQFKRELQSDGTYKVNAYDMDGNFLPDVRIHAHEYEELTENKEHAFSVSYQHDGMYQNRAARRKKKKSKGR